MSGHKNGVQAKILEKQPKALYTHCAGHVQTYLTESIARRHLGGALPFGFEDPSNISILKQMLINAFGGAEMSTQLSNFSARCTPIITVNTFVVDELTLAESRLTCTYNMNTIPFVMYSYYTP